MPIPTKIVPAIVLDAVKRSPPIYNLANKARLTLGSRLGARRLPGLDGRVHYNDFMLASRRRDDVAAYRRGAVEFLAILSRALAGVGRDWSTVDACLEVGCGYGRIVRELRRRVAARSIFVCDVVEEAAGFTAAEFGAHRVPPVEAMGLDYEETFDLAYVLSVYSHLRREAVVANLRRLAAISKPGAIIVFTTHGRSSAESADRYRLYWLDKAKLAADLDSHGIFHDRYPYRHADYGVTWITEDETRRIVAEAAPALTFVVRYPGAVDGDQDVFVYRKG